MTVQWMAIYLITVTHFIEVETNIVRQKKDCLNSIQRFSDT